MFDVYVLQDGVKLPKKGTYYVVAKNGIFLRKETGLIEAFVKVEGISPLQEISVSAKIKIPKIRAKDIASIVAFFRAVYEEYASEAIILIHYSRELKSFHLVCPEQRVCGASVEYDAHERMEGHQLIGSVHSHHSMGAFHSGTDITDESAFDGLHITIGSLHKLSFSVVASVVVNNNRFPMNPKDVISGFRQVNVRKKHHKDSIVLPAGFYALRSASPNPDVSDFPAEWMDKVVKREYAKSSSHFLYGYECEELSWKESYGD